MKLQMFGCSHHNSTVEIRERLAFSPQQAADALARFRQRFPASEAVLLSTCNRVEVYTAAQESDAAPTHEDVIEFLADFHGLDRYKLFDDLFQQSGEEAVRHLFMVAASLDSMVVGEPQILSQVKQAYLLADEQQSTGPITHEVFQAALRVAKRITAETTIHEKRISIPSVAVADFGRGIFERFDDKRVLVLGAGEMAEETLRYLHDEGARDITIINRSYIRARELADRWQGEAAPWDDLDRLLVAADIVVSTTGAEQTVVTRERYLRLELAREQRPLFVLDLAIPRDFDPTIGEQAGVYLYSIDDLRATCDRNRQQRDKELPAALAIVDQETSQFMSELHHRATGPIIQRLRQGCQELRDQELKRLFKKLPDLSPSIQNEIAVSFDRFLNKMLHPPLESLRLESRTGPPHGLVDALKRLFHLKD